MIAELMIGKFDRAIFAGRTENIAEACFIFKTRHVEASKDPAVIARVRAHIGRFLASAAPVEAIHATGRERNSYKEICREMCVGFVKNGRQFEMRKVGDLSYPSKGGGKGGKKGGAAAGAGGTRLSPEEYARGVWKDVWLFYFKRCVGRSILAGDGSADADSGIRQNPFSGDADEDAPVDDDVGMAAFNGDFDDSEEQSVEKLLALQAEEDDLDEDDEDIAMQQENVDAAASSSASQQIISPSLKNGSIYDASVLKNCQWTPSKKFLNHIKTEEPELWTRMSVLGINNCSGKKLVHHAVADRVREFFLLKGASAQELKPRRLRVAVGEGASGAAEIEVEKSFKWASSADEDDWDDNGEVSKAAKPVLFEDVAMMRDLETKLRTALGERPGGRDILLEDENGQRHGHAGGGEEDGNLHKQVLNAFNPRWRRPIAGKGREFARNHYNQLYEERKKNLRARLPAFKQGHQFVRLVADNDIVILCGATGCGKTTQLPQILMEELDNFADYPSFRNLRSAGGRIICTQPRRISATSVAERVCFERNEEVGDKVAYQIRFENKASDSTELLYCTTGILLRYLVHNPLLEGISVIILDEVHERSMHTDFVLLILRDLVHVRKAMHAERSAGGNFRQSANDNGRAEKDLGELKLVLMSATIDATNFHNYFGVSRQEALLSDHAGVSPESSSAASTTSLSIDQLDIPGKTNFPIDEFFVEELLPELRNYNPNKAGGKGGDKGGAFKIRESQKRNTWATPDALFQEHSTRDGNFSRNHAEMLSQLMQRPYMSDAELVASVVELIEERESRKAGNLQQGAKGKGTRKQNWGREDGDEDFLGSILIFVPGWREITDVIKALETRLQNAWHGSTSRGAGAASWASDREWTLLPLHSLIPPHEQNRIFDRPTTRHTRKIIVSTNLAETSITVEDVVYVIDSGLCRGTTYTAETNVASLETFPVARSNVQQRRGRAGRCRPGNFFKLYSKWEFENMDDHEKPEMMRTPVEELCLQVKAQNLPGPVQDVLMKAPDPPDVQAVRNAVGLLLNLGAFRKEPSAELMTPLGWQLSQMPIHPMLGKMLLLGNLFSPYEPQLMAMLVSICATLSFKSPFTLPMGKEKEADAAKKAFGENLHSDHICYSRVCYEYLNMRKAELGEWLGANFLSGKTLEMTEKTRGDLKQHLMDVRKRAWKDGKAGGGEGDDVDHWDEGGDSDYNGHSRHQDRNYDYNAGGPRNIDEILFPSNCRPAARGRGTMGRKNNYDDQGVSNLQLRNGSPLLMAILSVSLNLSVVFSSGGEEDRGRYADNRQPKMYCLIGGGAVEPHPGSLVAHSVKHCVGKKLAKRARQLPWGDAKAEAFQGDKIYLFAWFERLRTRALYLRDVSMVADPLPLLLLLPGVTRQILKMDEDDDDDETGGRGPAAAGARAGVVEERETPTRLFEVKGVDGAVFKDATSFHVAASSDDAAVVFARLRRLLAMFFDRVYATKLYESHSHGVGGAGSPIRRGGSNTAMTRPQMDAVFKSLAKILVSSYERYQPDRKRFESTAASSSRAKHYDADEEERLAMLVDEFGKCDTVRRKSVSRRGRMRQQQAPGDQRDRVGPRADTAAKEKGCGSILVFPCGCGLAQASGSATGCLSGPGTGKILFTQGAGSSGQKVAPNDCADHGRARSKGLGSAAEVLEVLRPRPGLVMG
eukprot:g1039.t1